MTNASTTPTPKSGIKTLKMQLQVSQASGVLLRDAMSLLIKAHNCLAAIIRAASDLYKNKQQRLRCKTLKNGLCISRKIRYQIEQAKNKRLHKAPKIIQTHKKRITCITKQFLHDDNSGKFIGDGGKKKRLDECRKIEKELAKTVNLLDQYSLRNTLPTLKAIYPYLQKLRSDPYKVLAMGLQTAAKAVIQKWSNGQKASLPRFKSGKKDYARIGFDEPLDGFSVDCIKNSLVLEVLKKPNSKSKYAQIVLPFVEKLPEHWRKIYRKDPQIFKTCSFYFDKQRKAYFASFTYEEGVKQSLSNKPKTAKKQQVHVLALDKNHINNYVGQRNDGLSIEIERFRFVAAMNETIESIQSKADTLRDMRIKKSKQQKIKIKTSHQERFLRNKIRKLRVRLQDRKKGATYTMAHTLCDHAQILVLGNYRPQISHEKHSEMQNKQRILEEADAYKRDILSQVCQKRGTLLLECDEAYTSCTCSVCGTIHKSIPTKHRIWRCVQCHSVLDRDENAAQNLLKRVLSRMFLQSLIDKKYILPSSGHLYTTVNQWMQDPAVMLYIKSIVQRCSFVFNGGCKARRTKAVKSLSQGRIFTGKLRRNPPSLGGFVAASLSKKKP